MRVPHRSAKEDPEPDPLEHVELSGIFAAPSWLRDLGFAAWLLAGVTVVVVGAIWIADLTSTIFVPVVVAAVLAAVLSPIVRLLQNHKIPRIAGAAIVFVGVAVAGAALLVMIVSGISSQSSDITDKLQQGATRLESALNDLGASSDSASQAKSSASSGLSDAFHTLLTGVGSGISALASLAVFISFTALSLFLLLKDGPAIRTWAERHLGIPRPAARVVLGRTLQSLRGYFGGVTAIAAFNGVVIGLGALIVGVPLAGTIAVVNFVAAYIPFLGAWTAGAFTVLIALGANGTQAALVMAFIVLIANGALQQMIQPVIMGAALGIHPLVVLIVTIGAGALFGGVGMVLAAPLTSAAVRISHDLAAMRAERDADAAEDDPGGAVPTPA
ncbi:Putative transport protein [Baekduia alba]|uniref:AI-2E family transporter n=1 Tax=Baekduia alba TaxID=2997333 RepID=UPI002340DB50|nr:AI-2E family transporter [Baekduia alba]WCB95197.1 Putative transport protein [Baekduia alba]